MSPKRSAILISSIILASTLAPLITHATTIVTYRGFVTQGFDQSGVFGIAKTDMSGLAFSAKFTIQNSTSPFTYLILSDGSFINNNQPIRFPRVGSGWDGRDYYPRSPMLSELTINGISVNIFGQRDGRVDHLGPNAPTSLVHHRTEDLLVFTPVDESVIIDLSVSSVSDKFTNSWDYRSPLYHDVRSDDIVSGRFQYAGYTCTTSCILNFASGALSPTSVLRMSCCARRSRGWRATAL